MRIIPPDRAGEAEANCAGAGPACYSRPQLCPCNSYPGQDPLCLGPHHERTKTRTVQRVPGGWPPSSLHGTPLAIPDYELIRPMAGEVTGKSGLSRMCLAAIAPRNLSSAGPFAQSAPFEREFRRDQKNFEPVSRTHPGCQYPSRGQESGARLLLYVMEIADDGRVGPAD